MLHERRRPRVVAPAHGPRVTEVGGGGGMQPGRRRVVVGGVAVVVAAEPHDLTAHRLRRVHVHAVVPVVQHVQL